MRQAAARVDRLPPGTGKFTDPDWTAKGERRARVPFGRLTRVWFNTGTLCNLSCHGCYIESSPRNDALLWLRRDEARTFLQEAARWDPPPDEVGFTGGEPFVNPDIVGMLEDAMRAGFRVLVLTNAMRPMQRHQAAILALAEAFGDRLSFRVSLDHHDRAGHERLRGAGSWEPALAGLCWLARHGLPVSVAGRSVAGESETPLRAGYARLFGALGVPLDAMDPASVVLFPELLPDAAVPEISESCWAILGKHPEEMMCASSRMVVKRKGDTRPSVVACTLLPHEPGFDLGRSLTEADRPVTLNHPHCARFCVLGSGSCA